MKTKQQELEIIESAISQLGNDSYLGPWLNGIKYELEAMMRADCFPMINILESRDTCDKQIKEAAIKAEQIIANAKQSAETLKRENDAKIARSQEWALSALQKAIVILQ
jgi:hypothetical protein